MANLGDLVKLKRGPSALSELKAPSGASVIVRLFTAEAVMASLHYGESKQLQGHFHCIGDDCPFCEAGKKATACFLIPVYGVVSNSIQILRLSESAEPHALLPQILAALDDPAMADKYQIIKRIDNFRFVLETNAANDRRHLGADVIRAFLESIEAGKVDVTSIYQRPSREDMLAVEEVRLQLELLGKLKDE